jgi:hypothetical protein
MGVHGGIVPFASTFLSFADYMRPSIRLASLSKAHVIYVWTHDSLALGEDGPTHQPVEASSQPARNSRHAAAAPQRRHRNGGGWRVALTHRDGPVGLVLTRRSCRCSIAPRCARTGLARGAYVLTEHGGAPDVIVIATGSEVSLALAAHDVLTRDGIASRVVSMPSWELFEAQPRAYRDAVLPPQVRARVSVEAASPSVGALTSGATASSSVSIASVHRARAGRDARVRLHRRTRRVGGEASSWRHVLESCGGAEAPPYDFAAARSAHQHHAARCRLQGGGRIPQRRRGRTSARRNASALPGPGHQDEQPRRGGEGAHRQRDAQRRVGRRRHRHHPALRLLERRRAREDRRRVRVLPRPSSTRSNTGCAPGKCARSVSS